MMRILKFAGVSMTLAWAALAAGCAADDELGNGENGDGGNKPQVTITVGTDSGTDTRVAYNGAGNSLTWQKGDKLAVAGFNGSTYVNKTYTLNDADDGKAKGSFTGEEIAGATKYNVYYPSSVTVDASGNASFALSAQTQDGENNTNHLRNNIFLQATNVTKLNEITLEMESSIMKFELTNIPAEVGTLKKLIWTVENENDFKTIELAFPTSGSNMVTFSGSNSTLNAYLAFLPGDMEVKADGKFRVLLEGNTIYKVETTIVGGKTYSAGKQYTAKINGGTITWKKVFIIEPTIAAGASYNFKNCECKMGTWNAENVQVPLGHATIGSDGKAYIETNTVSSSVNKDIWVCIPKVVKFFHKLTSGEVTANRLTLPDKDKGSTLLNTTIGNKKYANDWVVALYMGINKNGSTAAGADPIYWATGNLIATKTNAANSSVTTTAFHIATYDELKASATASNPNNPYDAVPENNAVDAYTACAIGSQWYSFGWGDATGLMTTFNSYASDINVEGVSISGEDNYDIARAQLGNNWRLPLCGEDRLNNEFVYFMPDSYSVDDFGELADYGVQYTYNKEYFNNILLFPFAGCRYGNGTYGRGAYFYYWSSMSTDPSSAYLFKCNVSNSEIFPSQMSNSRFNGYSVLPVTE